MTTQTTTDRTVETPRPAALPSGEALLRRRLLDVLQTPVEPLRLTYEEFLAWTDEDTLAEWVDGDISMTSPASDRHQDLAGFLAALLRIFVETHKLGVVRSAPFQMKLEHSGREPDVLFVAAEHLDRLQDTFLDGPADLAVEIVSPDSVSRDRGNKYTEYEAGGVTEYWLIDPQRRSAEFFHLEGSNFRQAAAAEGEYHALTVPGFWLQLEWLWQDPLPEVEDALLEIGGEAYARRWIERLSQRGFLPDK